MKNKNRISQCMIVKNEEKNIEKALSWGKGIVWEQIVVDTGSTDRTVEIARRMGARVLEFPWIDDFAAAKNYAIAQARGEWIAFLDADEVFAPGDEKKLPSLLTIMDEKRMDAAMTGWMTLDEKGQITSVGSQCRIFRNHPKLRYKRRIHEMLAWEDGRELKIGDASRDLAILHSGYQGKAYEEKKLSQRNLRLIQRELEDHPEDMEMLGYLGDEYHSANLLEEAADSYGKALVQIRKAPEDMRENQRNSSTLQRLLSILCTLNTEEKEVLAVYKEACDIIPQEADFDYTLGCHYYNLKRWEESGCHFEKALQILNQYGHGGKSMLTAGDLKNIYGMRAMCCHMLGQDEAAVALCMTVLKVDPYAGQPLYVLLKALRGEGESPVTNAEDAIAFLKQIYHFESLKDKVLLLQFAQKAEWNELAAKIKEMLSEEEIRALGL